MNTTTVWPLRAVEYEALRALDRDRGDESDVRVLLHAQPARLLEAVQQWSAPGPVTRFRELLAAGVTVDDGLQFVQAERPWTVVLFLTLCGGTGQDVAAAVLTGPLT